MPIIALVKALMEIQLNRIKPYKALENNINPLEAINSTSGFIQAISVNAI